MRSTKFRCVASTSSGLIYLVLGFLVAGAARSASGDVEFNGTLLPVPEGTVEVVLRSQHGEFVCQLQVQPEGDWSCAFPSIAGEARIELRAVGYLLWSRNYARLPAEVIQLDNIKLRQDPTYLELTNKLPTYYVRLGGRAVDLLAKGRLSTLSEDFSPEPFLVATPAYRSLSRFVSRFEDDEDPYDRKWRYFGNYELERNGRYVPDWRTDALSGQEEAILGTESWDRPVYLSVDMWSGQKTNHFDPGPERSAPEVQVGPDLLDWKIWYLTEGETRVNPLRPETLFIDAAAWRFWRERTCGDIEEFPRGVCEPGSNETVAVDFAQPIGCGYFGFDRYPWALQVKALHLENVSPEAIHLERFDVRRLEVDGVMSSRRLRSLVSSTPIEPVDLFTPKKLEPGASLLIPLTLELAEPDELRRMVESIRKFLTGTSWDETFDSFPRAIRAKEWFAGVIRNLQPGIHEIAVTIFPEELPSAAELEDSKRELSATGRPVSDEMALALYELQGLEANRLWWGSSDDLSAFVANLPLAEPPDQWDALTVGSALHVEGFEADQRKVAVRREPEEYYIIRATHDMGSCPFVFTRADSSASWEIESTILTGRDAAAKIGTSSLPLRRFDGTILLRELEPEISYIDSVWIEVLRSDGERIATLYPQDSILRKRDGRFLTMEKGDEQLIEFDAPPKAEDVQFRLHAHGYYVPERFWPPGLHRTP